MNFPYQAIFGCQALPARSVFGTLTFTRRTAPSFAR